MKNSNQSFIVDAPNALILAKNKVLSITTAKSGEIKLSGDKIDINAGQNPFAIASINTKSNLEISLKDAQFKMDAMAMQTGGTKSVKTTTGYEAKKFVVTSSKIAIPYVVNANSVKINGLEETTVTTPTTGKFKVTLGAGETTILFATEDVIEGETVLVAYSREIQNVESLSVKTTDTPSGGMVIVEYPCYGNNAIDKSVQEEIGKIQWVIFKCAITRDGGMGGSYKSASEFDLKFTALDPERADEKMFEVNFIPKAS